MSIDAVNYIERMRLEKTPVNIIGAAITEMALNEQGEKRQVPILIAEFVGVNKEGESPVYLAISLPTNKQDRVASQSYLDDRHFTNNFLKNNQHYQTFAKDMDILGKVTSLQRGLQIHQSIEEYGLSVNDLSKEELTHLGFYAHYSNALKSHKERNPTKAADDYYKNLQKLGEFLDAQLTPTNIVGGINKFIGANDPNAPQNKLILDLGRTPPISFEAEEINFNGQAIKVIPVVASDFEVNKELTIQNEPLTHAQKTFSVAPYVRMGFNSKDHSQSRLVFFHHIATAQSERHQVTVNEEQGKEPNSPLLDTLVSTVHKD